MTGHRFDQDDYRAAVEAAGVVELPTVDEREASYRELLDAALDPARLARDDGEARG